MDHTQITPIGNTDFALESERRLALAARLWNWEPHPGQRELLTRALADGSEPRVLVAACGRRWGKTEAISMDVAARLLLEPDLSQLALAPTRDQAEILFEAVWEKIQETQEQVATDPALAREFPHLRDMTAKRVPYAQIRLGGKTLFAARTVGINGRNLRGIGTTRKMKRFRVIIDERAFVPDSAVESVVKPMLATVPGGGGQMVEISSPWGRRGGFFADYCRGQDDNTRYASIRCPSAQNPLVDPDFLREMREEMSDRTFRAEFLAEFIETDGAVFPEAELLAALVPEEERPGTPLFGLRYVAGVDWGRRSDYTAVVILEIGAPCRVVALLRVRGLGWEGQIQRVAELLRRWRTCRVVCDRTGVGDPPTEALERELRGTAAPVIEGFLFSRSSKMSLVDDLSIAISQHRLVFPPHPDLLSELRHFTSAENRLEADTGHDDTVCALALAVRAAVPLIGRAGAVASSRGATPPRRSKSAWDEDDGQQDTGGVSFSVRPGALRPAVDMARYRVPPTTRLLSHLYRSSWLRWMARRRN